jgi:uncharacterized membrane protein YraQ (UPF0718 family)
MPTSLFSESAAKFVLLSALGVVVGGLILYFAKENDIPVLELAADGFDY